MIKYQNWNTFQTPFISQNLGIQMISCCMWCVTRSELVNFWNFRCRRRSDKGLLQLWLLRALKKISKRISRKQCGFIQLISYTVNGQSLRRHFFPMRNSLLMISMQCDVGPVKKFVIVDDSFNFGSLSFTIMFALKRFMIVDDSWRNHAKRSCSCKKYGTHRGQQYRWH